MSNIQLQLSENQISKLRRGHIVQISVGQMGQGDEYFLNSENLKKIHSAYNKNKGTRISFDEDEMEGSGFGGLRKGLKKATHLGNKINKTLHNENLDRKISTTSRKIKNSINKAQALGDLGIPVVSDVYNTIQTGVNRGDRVLQQGLKQKSKLVADFDQMNSQPQTGMGINQYMPSKRSGGSFRVLGGNMNRHVSSDSSTMLATDSPSNHPLALKSYREVQYGG